MAESSESYSPGISNYSERNCTFEALVEDQPLGPEDQDLADLRKYRAWLSSGEEWVVPCINYLEQRIYERNRRKIQR